MLILQLQGRIDDCTCNVDTVDYFNNVKIYPRLKSLLTKDYFRFYKVNLKRQCPFWTDDSRCAIRYCHIETCEEDAIPPGLKGEGRKYENKEGVLKNKVGISLDRIIMWTYSDTFIVECGRKPLRPRLQRRTRLLEYHYKCKTSRRIRTVEGLRRCAGQLLRCK